MLQHPQRVKVRAVANRPQCEFLSMNKKYRAFIAGFGSGKTFVGALAQCMHVWKHPNINQGYFAPTYPLIRDIFYPTIEEASSSMGLRVEIREGNKEVHFYRGRSYRGTTICRSMDKPESIIGFKIGNALVDEFDVLQFNKAQDAWNKIIARMRYNVSGLRNGVDVTTTPEGFKKTHQLFVENVALRPALGNNYGRVHASTYENEANLPEDYIPSLFESYTKEQVLAYINGQFVNLASGTVYRNYDRIRCDSAEQIRKGEPLFIGMDFNVTKMAATIWVARPNGWHAVAELKDLFDTPDMIKNINSRWRVSEAMHRIVIYPDASGDSRKSVDASKSDIAALRLAGYEVVVDSSNPSVKDRINATNKQFEISNLWVNSRLCPRVASCFERQVYDENGEPDKKGGYDHQNDASTYPIVKEFPIQHNKMQRIALRGT